MRLAQGVKPSRKSVAFIGGRTTQRLRGDCLGCCERVLHTVHDLGQQGAGVVREVSVHLARGTYEVYCNMAGHYMGGMRAFLVVT